MFALVLAGGSGTRLWPRSRRQIPKQLLDIATKNTMLQETFERLRPLMPPENVYVITNGVCAAQVARQLPEVPSGNVIVEPAGRNTAPAIGLGSLLVSRLDPEAVCAAVGADHMVGKVDEYVAVMRAAEDLARRGYLVTIGIRPSKPETGYGYIEVGAEIAASGGLSAHEVARFTEKPDRATAEEHLAGGRHLWNAGMFVYRVDVMLDAIRLFLPALGAALDTIAAGLEGDEQQQVLDRAWQSVPNISIDVGVMERASNVAVVPADLGWSDVGTWASLAEILQPDEQRNVVVSGEHIGVDTSGSLFCGGRRLIATIGLRDIVVVDTDDAVLICPLSRAQEVKDLVEKLRHGKRHEYL